MFLELILLKINKSTVLLASLLLVASVSTVYLHKEAQHLKKELKTEVARFKQLRKVNNTANTANSELIGDLSITKNKYASAIYQLKSKKCEVTYDEGLIQDTTVSVPNDVVDSYKWMLCDTKIANTDICAAGT